MSVNTKTFLVTRVEGVFDTHNVLTDRLISMHPAESRSVGILAQRGEELHIAMKKELSDQIAVGSYLSLDARPATEDEIKQFAADRARAVEEFESRFGGCGVPGEPRHVIQTR